MSGAAVADRRTLDDPARFEELRRAILRKRGLPILRYAHHEPSDPGAREWRFKTTGPLSGANGALTWIVFRRDRERFERQFPELGLERYEPHTPLRYRLSPEYGSFVDVERVRS